MDIAKLNSATKYPSIETYHVLEKGKLTEELGPFANVETSADVVLTEKVDGTNGRIVMLPNGDYFIGQRNELIYAKGDRIHNPDHGIVRTLKPVAEKLSAMGCYSSEGYIHTYFLEVYGGNVGGNAKQYTDDRDRFGYRLFDVAVADPTVLTKDLEQISAWREHGGQDWFHEQDLQLVSHEHDIPLTPRLGTVKASALPATLEAAQKWLTDALPCTFVALSGEAGRAEGIVLRTKDRILIAKARFEDYARTLNPQPRGKRR